MPSKPQPTSAPTLLENIDHKTDTWTRCPSQKSAGFLCGASQTNDLQSVCLSLPTLALGIIKMRKGLVISVSG